jgi:hypothetical protein
MKKDEIISGLQITCDELAYKIVNERNQFNELQKEFEIEQKLIDIYFITDAKVNVYKSTVYNGYINPFSDRFINYLHGRLHELKRKIKWSELVDLSYKFDILEMEYNISNNFKKQIPDFSETISLKDLFKMPINDNFDKNNLPF